MAFLLWPIAACGGNGGSGMQPTPTPEVTSVTLTPAEITLEVGATQQFSASVVGTGSFDHGVTWSVERVPAGNSSVGTVSDAGLYTTPFPAPARVTVTATSKANSAKSGTATVTITPKAAAAGPPLTVNASAGRHAISPFIYGMNNYGTNFDGVAPVVRLPLERWGGDATTRYNYQLDVYNAANDFYFVTEPNSNTQYPDVSDVNTMIERDRRRGTTALVTVPLIGWTTTRERACSFSVATYGPQQQIDPYNADCGNGVRPDGTNIVADPNDTSVPIGPDFVTDWVRYLVRRYGDSRHGGVTMYSLDNEIELWQFVHRDVHPAYSGYDDMAQAGLTYAGAIKDADPAAQIVGPVLGIWIGFFYSPQDWRSGWNTAPDFKYYSNPVDRIAHGNVPFIEWYLQQFAKAERQQHRRLLDYVDVHGYLAPDTIQFKPAGDTALQQQRLESVRVFWDPSYQVGGDVNDAPMLVRRERDWVARNYPGTRTAITEYNLGGLEHINGALAQADLLGVFGREGLDLATIWSPPDAGTPGMFAFKIFRNYDDQAGSFGETSVSASSGDQSQLSVYAAERRDHALTVLVINKTFTDLTSTISLAGFHSSGTAQVWRYSGATLDRIARADDQQVGPSSLSATFPAGSITLFVAPEH